MYRKIIPVLWLLSLGAQSRELKFPKGFKLGVATASYQIEGGWKADGKGPSVWDALTHDHPELIADHQTGDVACDSYHLWKDDITNLKNMKVDHYRFSLSWPRILPSGFSNVINPEGVKYYNNLIDGLIANKIEPMVTLFHWDLPQNLQNLGGWTNPLIADYFADFAKVAFKLFGDRVKYWITINEPASICVDVYEYDIGAPAFVRSPGIGTYLCGKTILLAHAKAFRLYDSEFRAAQKGKVGITIDSTWGEPKTNRSQDVEAAEREMQFGLGWWAHPIFSPQGDYPEVMKTVIAQNSKSENFSESRLPRLSPDEVKLIQGTFDFFGLNHYHTWLISDKKFPVGTSPSFIKDKGTEVSANPDWKPSPKIVPWGFRKLLNWVKKEYNNPLVIVTENGYGDAGGLDDKARVLFLKDFMEALLLAVLDDGCNVNGYTVWSIMDNMEWRSGYTVKFGLFDVNFTDPRRPRTPKTSAQFYQTVIKTRTLPEK
ncbi:Myrosinase 1-like Protein [Tribolium castaneum]|uniref:Myrosinase 1-like Protein n=1 Tax=Tribolium castaneum TaxID=7070 RepID=D6X3T6_TRICA|nr:PREDICTED: myrosinase 1 isoform X1 [Tribolium castaneum]EEZ97373.2 Myrosinase 1-like Protein [Tribolium castaneum]|eukprot:XP_970224.1 PREDICTED: myrosinase 1 isoform X1 [Tribolium castaneum]